jgi:hypothetical protein
MAGQNTKKTIKPHAASPNAMSGANMGGPANGGAMASEPANDTSSMSTPH